MRVIEWGICDQSTPFKGPLYSSVSAGFPSPADDHLQATLDLNQYLIKNPSATFFVRASGQSMEGAGIYSNDILIVDRSKEAKSSDIVIAVVDGEFLVKRFKKTATMTRLCAEHEDIPDLIVTADMQAHIWGVVTYVIHAV